MTDDAIEQLAERVAALVAARQPPARLLDARQVAEVLGVPDTWVRAEARAERIPHVRFGRYVRFDPAAVATWWREEHTHGPRSAGRAS